MYSNSSGWSGLHICTYTYSTVQDVQSTGYWYAWLDTKLARLYSVAGQSASSASQYASQRSSCHSQLRRSTMQNWHLGPGSSAAPVRLATISRVRSRAWTRTGYWRIRAVRSAHFLEAAALCCRCTAAHRRTGLQVVVGRRVPRVRYTYYT